MLALNGFGIGFLSAGPDINAMIQAGKIFKQLCVSGLTQSDMPAGWTAQDQPNGIWEGQTKQAIDAATNIIWKLYQNQNTLKKAAQGGGFDTTGLADRIYKDFQGMNDSYQGTLKQSNYAAAMDILYFIQDNCAKMQAAQASAEQLKQQVKSAAVAVDSFIKKTGRNIVIWYHIWQKIKHAASLFKPSPHQPIHQGPPPNPHRGMKKCWDGSWISRLSKCPPRNQKAPPIQTTFNPPIQSTPVAVTSGTCPDGTVIQFAPDYYYSAPEVRANILALQCPKPPPIVATFDPNAWGNSAQGPASVGQSGGTINYGAIPTAPSQQQLAPVQPYTGPTVSQPIYQGPPPSLASQYPLPQGQNNSYQNDLPADLYRTSDGQVIPIGLHVAPPSNVRTLNPQQPDYGIIGTEAKPPRMRAPINPGGGGRAPQPNQGPQVPLQPFIPGDGGFDPNSLPGGAMGPGNAGPQGLDRPEQFAPAQDQGNSDVMNAIIGGGGGMNGLGFSVPDVEASNKLLLYGLLAGLAYLALRK